MEDKYVSLQLAKKLKESGCELESDKLWFERNEGEYEFYDSDSIYEDSWHSCPFAYDIMWDICIRYKKEFFGDSPRYCGTSDHPTFCEHITHDIMDLIQKGDKKGAEDYLWAVCRFNPKNKEHSF